jgi:hypothetical protein
LNTAVGFVIIFWIIAPILYCRLIYLSSPCNTYDLSTVTNTFNSAYFPISAFTTWDNTGARYNASAVIDSNGVFNEQAYSHYSPIFMSITLVLAYAMSFAAFTAILVHTFRTWL